MSYNATILADSVSPSGDRLTTFEVTYPRIVHAELMTHRVFSRNSASTRAIPLSAQLRNLLNNPFIPEKFGVNQPGMQAQKNLEGEKHTEAARAWLRGRDRSVTTAIELILGEEIAANKLYYTPQGQFLSGEQLRYNFDRITELLPKSTDQIDLSETSMLNVHKQLAGRGLEAYMWHTVVVTATEFDNFFALRDHKDAQGEIATIAQLMRKAFTASTPQLLGEGEWHTPYVEPGEFTDWFDAVRASAARCAAVSYNRQHNRNPEAEFDRYEQLLKGGHMSPLEHQATPWSAKQAQFWADAAHELSHRAQELGYDSSIAESLAFHGNLRGWTQHRKQIPHEYNFGEM